MALLVQIDAANPTFDREQRCEEWIDQLLDHEDLLRAYLKSTFSMLDSRLHPTKVRLTPRQKKAKEVKQAAKLSKMQQQGAKHFMVVGYLQFPMPNGKLFRDCTIGEARKMAPKIGGLMNIITKLTGKPTDVIGKVYTDAQLKKLAA